MYFNTDAFCNQSTASFQGGSRDAKICSELTCWNDERKQCETQTELRAYDGTPCGRGKWCMLGYCTADPAASTAFPGEKIIQHCENLCANKINATITNRCLWWGEVLYLSGWYDNVWECFSHKYLTTICDKTDFTRTNYHPQHQPGDYSSAFYYSNATIQITKIMNPII